MPRSGRDESRSSAADFKAKETRGGGASAREAVSRRILPGRLCRRVRAQGLHRQANQQTRLPRQETGWRSVDPRPSEAGSVGWCGTGSRERHEGQPETRAELGNREALVRSCALRHDDYKSPGQGLILSLFGPPGGHPQLDSRQMVITQLTPELIREGATLVDALDRAGRSPDAALWLYSPDATAWTLLLADAKLGSDGPRKIYRIVQKTLQALRIQNQIEQLSLEHIALEKPDAPLMRRLSQIVGTSPRLDGLRSTKSVVNGTLIGDSYIYRLKRRAA